MPQHRRALEQTMELLRSAVDGLPDERERRERSGPRHRVDSLRVRPNQVSQLVFLDGGRGTGKTSVELSLRHALIERGGIDEMAEKPPLLPDTPPTDHLKREELREQLGRLEDIARHIEPHLVWLAPLDMEPMPEGLNILAALLVRLDQVIDDLDTRLASRYRRSAEGLLAQIDHDDPLRRKLDELRADVVHAWDGGMPSRSPGQPLRAWSEEVIIAETARLNFNGRLEALLDALAEHLRRRGAPDPLFVLVVDDFDLNPAQCVEVLRVIRMVTTPRLFFILAGDLELARHVMQLKAVGEAARLHGTEYDVLGERVQSMADSIAANNLRKLVPPAHRVELGPLPADEALDLPLPGRDATLRGWLEDTRLSGMRGGTLAHLFVGLDGPILGAPWLRPGRLTGGFRAFFAVPIRVLVDTQMALARLGDIGASVNAAALGEVVAGEMRRRVDEADWDAVPRALYTPLRRALDRHAPTDACDLQLDTSAYQTVGAQSFTLVQDMRWVDKLTREPIPAALSAGLSLIHDLGVLAEHEARRTPLDDDISLGWTKHPVGTLGVQISWPVLPWMRLIDLQTFHGLWQGAILSSAARGPKSLLDCWMTAWRLTEARLTEEGEDPPGDARERRARVLSMLAPEMGWSPGDCQRQIEASELAVAAAVPSFAARIRQLRWERLEKLPDAVYLLPMVSPPAWRAFLDSAIHELKALESLLEELVPRTDVVDPRRTFAAVRGPLQAAKSRALNRSERAALIRAAAFNDVVVPELDGRDPLVQRIREASAMFGAPWDVIVGAVAIDDGPYNQLADGALCPDLGTLQRQLNWPAFAHTERADARAEPSAPAPVE